MVGIAFSLQLHALAAIPTYTGCYSASSGTINKLAIGWSPQKPCNTGDVQVSFSAGDITKISVTGGLTGGGDNGDITISLDPKYSLPQSCPATYIAKWNGSSWQCAADENTTYTNGIGLNLTGTDNAFNILPGYRLPQSCSDGQVPQAASGNWNCATPARGTRAYAANPHPGGIPLSNFTEYSVATLTVPAGLYVVFAEASLSNADSDPQNADCRLYVDGTQVDAFSGARLAGAGAPGNSIGFPFLSWGTVNQTIEIKCDTYNGAGSGRITAIPVNSIN